MGGGVTPSGKKEGRGVGGSPPPPLGRKARIFEESDPEKKRSHSHPVGQSPARPTCLLSGKCPSRNTAKGKLLLNVWGVFCQSRRYNRIFPRRWTGRLPDRVHHSSVSGNEG